MSAELDGLQELMVVKCLETIRDNADDSWNVDQEEKQVTCTLEPSLFHSL